MSAITVPRAVLEQALEALIHMCHNTLADKGYDGQLVQDAIDGLKGSLAQQEQEPVAWQWLNSAYFRRKPPANAESGAWNPLYTARPRREWVSLTDEEIRRMGIETPGQQGGWNLSFARAIEAKLKEKNT